MYIVYPNNEKISVDPWLLCDILQGLKALCDMSRRIQHFSNPFLAFYCPFKVIKNILPISIIKLGLNQWQNEINLTFVYGTQILHCVSYITL